MRRFDYGKWKDALWDIEILSLVSMIHEYKGKQAIYLRQRKTVLERMMNTAGIESAQASNWIGDITTTQKRLPLLLTGKTIPKDRNEAMILGYWETWEELHDHADETPVDIDHILQIHRGLLRHTKFVYKGRFKTVANPVFKVNPVGKKELIYIPFKPFEASDGIRMICSEYAAYSSSIDPLILIPVFINDFLCIHPFSAGNGRVSRLLTYLLLQHAGYDIGTYVSLEQKIKETVSLYQNSLTESDRGWHESKNDSCPFIRYLLRIIHGAYQEWDRMMTVKVSNEQAVRHLIESMAKGITKDEISRACPQIALSTLEGILRKMEVQGEIQKVGMRKIKYLKK